MKQIFLLLSISIFLFSCEKKEQNPKITTLEANPISASSCIAKAQISEMGSYKISDHGFISYFTSSNNSSYINDQNKISLGTEIASDTFSATIPLLNYYSYTGYKWYVRAYVTNEKGTIYGNAISFDPLVVSLQSISPTSAKIGDTISIIGNNFDPVFSNNQVQFYYYYSNYTAKVVSASRTKLKVIVPNFSSSNYSSYSDITVTTGGHSVTLSSAFSLATSVTGFYPASGTFGNYITITGSNLGIISGIMFGNTLVSYYSSYSNSISISIPNNVTTKKFRIYVIYGTTKTEVPGGDFVMNSLTTTSFSPAKAIAGSTLTIYGSNFNSSSSYNSIFIGSTKITNLYNYSNYLTTTIPGSQASGNYIVRVSNGLDTVTVPGTLQVVTPTITGISPSSSYWGSDLIISGHNLNTSSSYVYFGSSSYYAYSYDSTTFKITVPQYLNPGTYKISLYNGSYQYYSPTDFTLLAPTLSSVTPSTGAAGTSVIIAGAGFGTSISNVSVKFGSIVATISAINNNQINVIVPSSITKGSWMITVIVNSYTITSSLTFTIP